MKRFLDLVESPSTPLFLMFIAVAIIVSRLTLIIASPSLDRLPDLSIYRATGELVANGINPYVFSAAPASREAIRRKWIAVEPRFSHDKARFNYYVSSNLPASSALYGLIYYLFGDDAFMWRLSFVLGDLLIFVGAATLLYVTRNRLDQWADRLGLFLLCVIYPSLLIQGTLIAEDKQFQTGLVLIVSALLVRQMTESKATTVVVGLLFSLGVLFKFVGTFLSPLFIIRYFRQPVQRLVISGLSGLVLLVFAFAFFGPDFVLTMAGRAEIGSLSVPQQASPWQLFSALDLTTLYLIRNLVVGFFVGLLCLAIVFRRIDLLNFCAALTVLFLAFWLMNGAINRINIGMLFAMFCVLARLPIAGVLLVIFNTIAQAIIYPSVIFILREKIDYFDDVVVALFVASYIVALIIMGSVRSDSGASEARVMREQK